MLSDVYFDRCFCPWMFFGRNRIITIRYKVHRRRKCWIFSLFVKKDYLPSPKVFVFSITGCEISSNCTLSHSWFKSLYSWFHTPKLVFSITFYVTSTTVLRVFNHSGDRYFSHWPTCYQSLPFGIQVTQFRDLSHRSSCYKSLRRSYIYDLIGKYWPLILF